jgi:NAD(P)-dependent dehydrogenase (short-subunit alcohol dehydrogenase family)
MLLQKRTVIITGATGGLGRVLARRLYDEGCNLVLAYRTQPKRGETEGYLPAHSDRILWVQADIINEDDVSRLFRDAVKKFSTVDILCNAAGGYMDQKSFAELTLDEWHSIMDKNLTSCFLTNREAIRVMRNKQYGRIINIAAKPALYPEAERGAYAVSKAAVVMLTRMLGREYRKTGITVNALAPSIIKTPENESWGAPDEMKHWVTPDQLADTILFLCTESAKSINGAVIESFGGV